MADYIPAIQEDFRRHGYPIERAGKAKQITITPTGVQATEQERWEYRTKDETRSILILQDSVVLQTTSYTRFEEFAEQLLLAVKTVLSKTEHDKLGVIQRIGLRYVDLVIPDAERDFRFHVRPGLHGVPDQVFLSGSNRLHVENVGATEVGDAKGTMIVRVVQNDQGQNLPPDLVGGAPKHTPRTKPGEVCTIVDMDHFIEGNFDPDPTWVVEKAYRLHDHLVETLHDHVVTREAVEVWK
jgi:uncharacterized protein (TIGR04255 family)